MTITLGNSALDINDWTRLAVPEPVRHGYRLRQFIVDGVERGVIAVLTSWRRR